MPTLPFMTPDKVVDYKTRTPIAQGEYLYNAPTMDQYKSAKSTDYTNYDKYLGTLPSITGSYNHNEIMSRTQSATDMFGNALVQTGATLVGEAVTLTGGIQALGELVYKSARLGLTGKDFEWSEILDNPLINAGIDFQNYIRDEFKIHQTEEATNGLALGDASWWFGNAPFIASVAASMFIPAGAVNLVTKGGNMLLKGANKLASSSINNAIGKSATKVLETTARGLGKGLTSNIAEKGLYAGIGAHSDIFIEVAHGFQDKIDEYMNMGYDREIATKRASEWAGDAYMTAVPVGLATNYLQARLLLGNGKRWARHDESIDTELKKYIKGRSTVGPSGTIAEPSTIKSVTNAIKPHWYDKPIVDHIGNMLNEGVEEMRVDYIMQNADQQTRIKYDMPLLDLDMDAVSRLGSFLTDSKNYTSFVFGALGAGVTKLTMGSGAVNTKIETSEYVQRSLESIERIDNTMTTGFTDESKAIDPTNPNSLRIKGNSISAPIHDIAQTMISSSSEIGSGIFRYVDMLSNLSDTEISTYFGIKESDIKDTRSFMTSIANELKIVDDIRKSVQAEYKNKTDVKNKDIKQSVETSLRYSKDYFNRQLNISSDVIKTSLHLDPAYQTYINDSASFTPAQHSIADKLIEYSALERDLQAQIELTTKDINSAKLSIPTGSDIEFINTRIAELQSNKPNEEVRDSVNKRAIELQFEIGNTRALLANPNMEDAEREPLIEKLNTLRKEESDINNKVMSAGIRSNDTSSELEQLIRIKHNIERNKDLYTQYANLEKLNNKDIERRKVLMFDMLTLKSAKLKQEIDLFKTSHSDNEGGVSENYKLASSNANLFNESYTRAIGLHKSIQASIQENITSLDIQLEDIVNGEFDKVIEETKATAKNIININSTKQLSKQVTKATTLSELATLQAQVEKSPYYNSLDAKDQNKINKEINSKEKELKEIEASRFNDITSNIRVEYDSNGDVVSVTRKYRYDKSDGSPILLTFKKGQSVILADSSVIEIAGFDIADKTINVVTSDGNIIKLTDLFKINDIKTIAQLDQLINNIFNSDSSVSETEIVNLIGSIKNIDGIITDLSETMSIEGIDVLISLSKIIQPISQIEGLNATQLTYNRLSKLIDILISKSKLTSYNSQFSDLFIEQKLNDVYDKVFKAILNSTFNASDVFLFRNNGIYVSDTVNKLDIKFTKDDINVIETLNARSVDIIKEAIIESDSNTYEYIAKVAESLHDTGSLGTFEYNQLIEITNRIKDDNLTDEDIIILNRYVVINDSPSLSKFIIQALNRESLIRQNIDTSQNTTAALNDTINLGVSAFATIPVNSDTEIVNKFISDGIVALNKLIENIFEVVPYDTITSYSILRYYISRGLSMEDATQSYSNIVVFSNSLRSLYDRSTKTNTSNESHIQQRANIKSILDRVSKNLELKTDSDIKREYEAILSDDTKSGYNGIRIELPLFKALEEYNLYEDVYDLDRTVPISIINKKGKIIQDSVSIERLFEIQNELSLNNAELFIKSYGINGYETFLKIKEGYVSLEKVKYASDNLVVQSSNGRRTVYNTPTFSKVISALSNRSTIKINDKSYTPAGELRLMYNQLRLIRSASESTRQIIIDDVKTILNDLHQAHIENGSTFIWADVMTAILELERLSEKTAANQSTGDVEYETYLDNPIFVDRVVDMLKPIYTNSNTKEKAEYISYADIQSYNDLDIEIVESRIRRAHNNFTSQYEQRNQLRKFADKNILKPIVKVTTNNPSLNYVDVEQSHNIFEAYDSSKTSTGSIPYIRTDTKNGVVTIVKHQGTDSQNVDRLQSKLNLDLEVGRTIRPTYILIKHANGNTSYAPTYNGRLDSISQLENGNDTITKIDKYVEFIITSLIDKYQFIPSSDGDSTKSNILLSNGRVVSKNDILNDLSHIFTTGSDANGVTYFDFNRIGNELQIEYVANGRSNIVNITFTDNKPTHIAYAIKNAGFDKVALSSTIDSKSLYKMIFTDKGGPRILYSISRSTPFGNNNEFEFSRTYKTLYDYDTYSRKPDILDQRFIPVYELFNSNIEDSIKYRNAFDYIVRTNALVTNITPILKSDGSILTYNSPTPDYEMSIVASIGNNVQVDNNVSNGLYTSDVIKILANEYKDNIALGLKHLTSKSGPFANTIYPFNFEYSENGKLINVDDSILDIFSKMSNIAFDINKSDDGSIMKFKGVAGKYRIEANESKLYDINAAGFKTYMSHELVHAVLTSVRNNKAFDKNKDNIRNIFIELFNDLKNDSISDVHKNQISNLLKYVFRDSMFVNKSDLIDLDTIIESPSFNQDIDSYLFDLERWQELVTYAYTDITFANMFNELSYNGNFTTSKTKSTTSISDSGLVKAFKKFFKTILDILGIDINKGSYLEAINTIVLNSNNNKLRIVKKDTVSNVKESDLISPTSSLVGTLNQNVDDTIVDNEQSITSIDIDIDLFAIDISDGMYRDSAPTREEVGEIKDPSSTINGNNLLSLGIEQDIDNLYRNVELNNNLKIC